MAKLAKEMVVGTIQVNMHEAKTRLSQLGEEAWEGKTVVIAKSGKPYLDLTPHKERARVRKPGRLKGKIKIGRAFNTTPEDVVDSFEGT